jgi:hypothetical protein
MKKKGIIAKAHDKREIYMIVPEDCKQSWFNRFLMRFFPSWWQQYTLLRMGISANVFRLDAWLKSFERVDFFLLSGGDRGFRIIFDKEIALYFHQRGDSFEYDGWEAGEYEDGDVTILDGVVCGGK